MLREEDSIAALARKHGVAEASIYRLHDQFLAGGLDGLKPNSAAPGFHDEVQRLQNENNELKIALGEYSIANKILKERAELLR